MKRCEEVADLVAQESKRLVISGRPITKKNSSRVVRNRGRVSVLPSGAYEEYELSALRQLLPKRNQCYVGGVVSVTFRYYMQNKRSWPDLVNLLQATSDILTKAGIIDDDKWIADYDDSCIVGVDKGNPRVEITIIPIKEGHILHELYAKHLGVGQK